MIIIATPKALPNKVTKKFERFQQSVWPQQSSVLASARRRQASGLSTFAEGQTPSVVIELWVKDIFWAHGHLL